MFHLGCFQVDVNFRSPEAKTIMYELMYDMSPAAGERMQGRLDALEKYTSDYEYLKATKLLSRLPQWVGAFRTTFNAVCSVVFILLCSTFISSLFFCPKKQKKG